MAIAFAVVGVSVVASAEPGAPDPGRVDLSDAATPRLEEQETSYIPFKDRASYQCLLEGWRTRWWEPVCFSDMLWATSLRASVEVMVLLPAERTMVLRLAPFDGPNPKLPAQRVEVLWNGARLGECVFAKEDGWTLKDFRFQVPATIQTKGKNTLTFLSRYCVTPFVLNPEQFAAKPDEGRDPIAFGLDSIRLSRADEGAVANSRESQSDFLRDAATFANGTIAQAGNTRITVPVSFRPSGHCVFSLAACSAQGHAKGSISLRWDTRNGPRERTLATCPAEPEAKVEALEVPIAEIEGSVAEVVFEATAADGNASQAQVVWTRPALRMESAAPVQEVQKVTPRETPHADNVLFIVLDACRADSMGCYGYARDTTPFIDTLARKGLLFERAYSAAPYTYSSTWSLYTSLFPFQHGAPMVPKRPSDSLPMIQKTLHDAGIVTGFACGNPWSFDTGMAKGYDEFLPAYEHIFLKNPPERTPGGVTHRAMDFMFRHRKERFFLYAHYMLPHEPYVPPAPFLNRFTTDLAQTMPATAEAIRSVNFGERGITGEELNQLKARYDENLLSADAEVAQLCQSLSALGIAEKTLIVVTADHGESFMEHGVLSHNLTVNEEVMWIPMVFSGPMLNDRAGERPAEIVRNVDLYPTLCAAMGAPTSDSLEGRNLLSGAVGDDGIRAFGQATYDRHPLEAYWWPRYKLIRDDYSACVEVYDLAMDPKEKNNLATPAPVLTDYLLANARLWKERGRARSTPPKDDVVISPDASKQLRSAGYMGY